MTAKDLAKTAFALLCGAALALPAGFVLGRLGRSVEPLQGLYIFADFVSDNLWSVPSASLVAGSTQPSSSFTNRNASFAPNAGSLTSVTSFGEDQAGNLFIVSIGGDVFMIQSTG